MIDPKKQYRTRDGREVRIYAVDGKEPASVVHGAVNAGDGWVPISWHSDGRYNVQTGGCDLIEVRPRIQRKVWVNVYRGRETIGMTIHDERDEADDYVDHEPRIACVEIEIDVEEGHGL